MLTGESSPAKKLAPAQRNDRDGITNSARSLAVIYMYADFSLPKDHANHVRKLVEMNLDIIIAEGHQDKFSRVLSDMESQLKVSVKSSPEAQKVYSQLMQEMLSQPD